MAPLDLIALRRRDCKNSFNALLGAVEATFGEDEVATHIVEEYDELEDAAARLAAAPQGPPVVAAVSFATPAMGDVATGARRLRGRCGDRAFLVAGGPHPSGDPVGTLAMGFDAVAQGEGEETLVELLGRLLRGDDPAGTPGLWTSPGGEPKFGGRRPPMDLDRYPPFPLRRALFGGLEITRGCPFGCGFCQTPRLAGGRPRHRSLDAILRGFEPMVRRGLRHYRVITPNALSWGSEDGRHPRLERLEELLMALRGLLGSDRKLFFGTFPSEVRPEQLTDEALALLRRWTDNDNLIIGAQSGSDRLLERVRRGHAIADVHRAVERARAHGYRVGVDFIFGLPGEEEADVEASFAAIERLEAMGARINIHTFLPLPGTRLADGEVRPLDERTVRRLQAIVSRGGGYGNWREHERHAARIGAMMRKGV